MKQCIGCIVTSKVLQIRTKAKAYGKKSQLNNGHNQTDFPLNHIYSSFSFFFYFLSGGGRGRGQ